MLLFFFFSLDLKQNTFLTFPNTQKLKVNHKIHNVRFLHQNCKLPSLNKKCKPLFLVIAYSYRLGLNVITMLELCRCRWKVEGNWHFFFFFCLSVFEIGWYEELWACVYKRVELKRWMEMQRVLCVWKRGKVLNI